MVATLAAATVLGAGGAVNATADAAPAVTVTVDAGASLGTVPDTGLGLNTGFGDGNMGDATVSSLMKAAGVRQLRYPGGSGADFFHWKPGSGTAPATDFDHFMATAKTVGAQPILTANYGSGTPQEAAEWVKYANVDKGYGVKYWEIGNEVYGNGHYGDGKGWEQDDHADKSPTAYATNLVAYSKAMKAVDPTVKIGAVLTTPGGWPDTVKAPGDSADWNHTVLSIAGNSIDFVIVHWYPGGSTTADLLNTPGKIGSATATLRSLIATYAGSHAASVEIAVTETDAVGSPALTSQAAALFAPDTYMTWFEHGAADVDWWNLHNGTDQAPTTVNGQTDYQDGGVLSVGGCVGGKCQPPRETPYPTYWGIRSLTALAQPGDTIVKASSGNPSVAVHAVRSSNGGLNVMLINKDPANPVTASLSYAGYKPAPGAVTTVSYLKGGTALTTASAGTAASQTLPPYSITTLQLKPADGKTTASTTGTRTTSSAPAAATPTSLRSSGAAGAPGAKPTHGSAPASQTSAAGGPQTDGTTAATTPVGNAVAHDAPASGASIGPLALTGAGSVVTYGIAAIIAIAAGSVLMMRRRNAKAVHRGVNPEDC
ncbi:MAG: cellulose-binding protein [Streptomyces sp.]|nr:cellulose-binding protein [Streptomyces sp.]